MSLVWSQKILLLSFLASVNDNDIISLGVLLPNSAGLVNLTKEEQKNLVAQILTEVPLIDG